MSNTIVRMEMSSISTSLLVRGFISNQRLWTSVYKNSSATISSLTRESRFCVRDVMTSLYLRFKLVQGLQCMRTHSCQTIVWRQRAARLSITFSDRRLWGSAAHCFLTAAPALLRSTASSSISIKKRVCMHKRMHKNECLVSLTGLSYNQDLD